jgi:UDP-N-acetylmuramoylalanine--D-glutamate ligase
VSWRDKKVAVLGLGASGRAATKLLLSSGAKVVVVDEADNPALREVAAELRALGAEVLLGTQELPASTIDLAVVSPGVPPSRPAYAKLLARQVPIMGELELGYEHSYCLNVAITGTNGKTSTTEMVERVLTNHGFKTLTAGNNGRPLCEITGQTRELDFLTLEVSCFQLESIRYFRPVVAVLLNLGSDHMDRYERPADYVRAKARLFMNQQPFDWAIVQSEALARLREMKVKIPSKVITFSVHSRRADLFLDRSLLISRLPGWEGPLLDLDKCRVRGPHHAENLLSALAVGRVLRIPLETMVEPLKAYEPPAHRCELVRTIGGVSFINDSKSTNLEALQKALLSTPTRMGGEPNVWLIAGGKDKGLDYHDLGPLLSHRVKGAFLLGETREKMRAAWSLFTPCTLVDSLLEAVPLAAEHAVAGDVILFSPACSSLDQFRHYRHRGEIFREAVNRLSVPEEVPGGSAGAAGRREFHRGELDNSA